MFIPKLTLSMQKTMAAKVIIVNLSLILDVRFFYWKLPAVQLYSYQDASIPFLSAPWDFWYGWSIFDFISLYSGNTCEKQIWF